MLAITHALTGAAIAKLSPSPEVGYLMALISHPILDYIPHWDMMTRHTNRKVTKTVIYSLSDAALGFLFGLIIFSRQVNPFQLFITMLLAQAPDWLEAPYTVFKWHFPPFTWIKKFQHIVHKKTSFPDGVFTQLIVVFLMLLLAK